MLFRTHDWLHVCMHSLNKESGIKCVCSGHLAYPCSAGEDCCFAAHIVNEVNEFNFVALGLLLRWRASLCTSVWKGSKDGAFQLRCNLTGCRPCLGTPFFSFPKACAIITTKALHSKEKHAKIGHNINEAGVRCFTCILNYASHGVVF